MQSFVMLIAIGQHPADTLFLREIEIKATFPVNSMGFKRVLMDSAILLPQKEANLSDILAQYSTIFVKSYGVNSLATPSFRGTTAHHTVVEWNGVNINSPMLGQTDLSQIPVSQFDGIEILYGAAGIARSGGAFGGIVNLTTTPDWNNRYNLSISQSVASFSNIGTTLNAVVGNRKLQSHTRANFSAGQNDFLYYNDFSGKVERQTNASFNKYGFSEDIYWKLTSRQLLNAKIWYSFSDVNLPPVTSETDSVHNENQSDKSLRALIEYKYVNPDLQVSLRSALIDQYMRYRNDSLDAEHQYYSSVNKFRVTWTGFRNFTIKPGIDLTYDLVDSDGYAELKNRLTIGGFAEVIWDPGKRLTISLLAREDIIDGQLMPFIPAIGAEYRPLSDISLAFSANLARNYRYPTLNDLYWDIYGNPDLLPEISYMAEAGAVWNHRSRSDRFFIEAELTGYYSWIYDMIVWIPAETNSSIWKPMNVSEVWARGIEVGLHSTVTWRAILLTGEVAYNFCRSTYEKATSLSDASKGNQLIYIPEHTLNASVRLSMNEFFFTYVFNYIGRRYTGTDNLSYMPGYNLSNIFFGRKIDLNKIALSLQLEINNLFDLDYQSVANRPMPGRNFGISVRVNLIDKQKDNL